MSSVINDKIYLSELIKKIASFSREKFKINEHSNDCILILLFPLIEQTDLCQLYANGFTGERLYQTLKQFLELEEKIESIWQHMDKNELSSLPTLRLQYDEIINHDLFQWFNDKLNNYAVICDTLLFELSEGMLKQLRNNYNVTIEPNSGIIDSAKSNIASKSTIHKIKGEITTGGGRIISSKKQLKSIEKKSRETVKMSDDLLQINTESSEIAEFKVVTSIDGSIEPANDGTSNKSSSKMKLTTKKQTIVSTDNQSSVNKVIKSTGYSRASSSKNLGVNYDIEHSRLSRTVSASKIKRKIVLNNYDKEYNLSVRSGILNYKYTVGNALLEAQVLRRALKYVSKQGGTKQQLAIKKIRVWWIIVYPRYKYIRKLSLNSVIANILFEITDTAVVKSIIRKKRHLRHRREHAARVIQQALRAWKKESLWLLKKNSQFVRASRLKRNISIWSFRILIGLALWKYTKKWRQRFMKRNPYRRPLYFVNFMEKWFTLQRQSIVERKKIEITSEESENIDKKRQNYVSKANRAAIVIQKYVRRLIVKHRIKNQRYLMFMKKKISRFMISTNISSRIRIKRNRVAAAILLQKVGRGFIERMRLFRRFDAGIKIYKFFLKIKSHSSLRKSLRRVERPITIVLRGLRNIHDSFDDGTNGISCKICIWWNPLLHIIGENDFQTILTTKQPQLIYTSKVYPMTPMHVYANNASNVTSLPTIIKDSSPPSFEKAPSIKNRLSFVLFSSPSTINLRNKSHNSLNTATSTNVKKTKWICKFDEEVEKIKIPGCHCNCLIKFEFVIGERKIGAHVYYMSKEGGLMFWNGNYSRSIMTYAQRKTALSGRSNTLELVGSRKGETKIENTELPLFDYSIYTGPPMRSRCQWGRVKFHGNGPGKRSMQQKGLLISLLEKWFKFYISVDGESLMLFDSKTTTQCFYKINVKDFKSIRVEQGVATRNEDNTSKVLVEDLMDVILVTTYDIIYFRFFDTGSRIFWTDTFNAIIEFNKKSSNGSFNNNNNTFLSGLGFKL